MSCDIHWTWSLGNHSHHKEWSTEQGRGGAKWVCWRMELGGQSVEMLWDREKPAHLASSLWLHDLCASVQGESHWRWWGGASEVLGTTSFSWMLLEGLSFIHHSPVRIGKLEKKRTFHVPSPRHLSPPCYFLTSRGWIHQRLWMEPNMTAKRKKKSTKYFLKIFHYTHSLEPSPTIVREASTCNRSRNPQPNIRQILGTSQKRGRKDCISQKNQGYPKNIAHRII